MADFYRGFTSSFGCEPAVRAALQRLRAGGWKVGIVTNGSSNQEDKIVAAGLDRLVDGWCVSAVEDVRKPDPELLRRAAARCGAELAGAWMVGDSPDADVGAAVAAGIPSVWLRRGRHWPPRPYGPTAEADTFAQAVDRVLGAPI